MLGLLAALFAAGMATGAALAAAVIYRLPAPARPALPAATAREVARERRRRRADLRLVMQPIRGLDARDVEPQRPRLGEPPSFAGYLPSIDSLDEEHTQP